MHISTSLIKAELFPDPALPLTYSSETFLHGIGYYITKRRISRYNQGAAYLEQGDYAQAKEIFMALGEYEDAPVLAVYAEKGVAYTSAKEAMAQGDFDSAVSSFEALSGFKDSGELLEECQHALQYENYTCNRAFIQMLLYKQKYGFKSTPRRTE